MEEGGGGPVSHKIKQDNRLYSARLQIKDSTFKHIFEGMNQLFMFNKTQIVKFICTILNLV